MPEAGFPVTGSSPHTRGARRLRRRNLRVEGIIPAYAGSTSCARPWPSCRSDHPRIRGEHPHVVSGWRLLGGSSPHTRGAPPSGWISSPPPGIIPAYAGSTGTQPEPSPTPADHPRIRGEHCWPGPPAGWRPGSSPHTRGARRPAPRRDFGMRIIPAYAGSTRTTRSPRECMRDHPRIRGEHRQEGRSNGLVWGSSPHTRGARRRHPPAQDACRIIPAYAGSTQATMTARQKLRDHPRIRGEHSNGPRPGARPHGSSPHTRGAPHFPFPPKSFKRIIPAYAGSTPWCRSTL